MRLYVDGRLNETRTAPARFPVPDGTVVGALGIVAALDRALMLRHHWLLD
ncbi:hypothetical protein [Microbacterium halotolerans]|nr:hypothetical protein [Microbacterium halotolerans]